MGERRVKSASVAPKGSAAGAEHGGAGVAERRRRSGAEGGDGVGNGEGDGVRGPLGDGGVEGQGYLGVCAHPPAEGARPRGPAEPQRHVVTRVRAAEVLLHHVQHVVPELLRLLLRHLRPPEPPAEHAAELDAQRRRADALVQLPAHHVVHAAREGAAQCPERPRGERRRRLEQRAGAVQEREVLLPAERRGGAAGGPREAPAAHVQHVERVRQRAAEVVRPERTGGAPRVQAGVRAERGPLHAGVRRGATGTGGGGGGAEEPPRDEDGGEREVLLRAGGGAEALVVLEDGRHPGERQQPRQRRRGARGRGAAPHGAAVRVHGRGEEDLAEHRAARAARGHAQEAAGDLAEQHQQLLLAPRAGLRAEPAPQRRVLERGARGRRRRRASLFRIWRRSWGARRGSWGRSWVLPLGNRRRGCPILRIWRRTWGAPRRSWGRSWVLPLGNRRRSCPLILLLLQDQRPRRRQQPQRAHGDGEQAALGAAGGAELRALALRVLGRRPPRRGAAERELRRVERPEVPKVRRRQKQKKRLRGGRAVARGQARRELHPREVARGGGERRRRPEGPVERVEEGESGERCGAEVELRGVREGAEVLRAAREEGEEGGHQGAVRGAAEPRGGGAAARGGGEGGGGGGGGGAVRIRDERRLVGEGGDDVAERGADGGGVAAQEPREALAGALAREQKALRVRGDVVRLRRRRQHDAVEEVLQSVVARVAELRAAEVLLREGLEGSLRGLAALRELPEPLHELGEHQRGLPRRRAVVVRRERQEPLEDVPPTRQRRKVRLGDAAQQEERAVHERGVALRRQVLPDEAEDGGDRRRVHPGEPPGAPVHEGALGVCEGLELAARPGEHASRPLAQVRRRGLGGGRRGTEAVLADGRGDIHARRRRGRDVRARGPWERAPLPCLGRSGAHAAGVSPYIGAKCAGPAGGGGCLPRPRLGRRGVGRGRPVRPAGRPLPQIPAPRRRRGVWLCPFENQNILDVAHPLAFHTLRRTYGIF